MKKKGGTEEARENGRKIHRQREKKVGKM